MKKKLKFKNSIIVDQEKHRVKIFRSDQFLKLMENKENYDGMKKIF